MTDKKNSLQEYKKLLWAKGDKMDLQSFMNWYDIFLKKTIWRTRKK